MGGVFYRYKPIIPVGLASGGIELIEPALLDSAADDTVFPRSAGEQLGIDFDHLPLGSATSAGSHPVTFALAAVELSITDGTERFVWTAQVGFRLDHTKSLPLLGQSGFLQFFTTEFHGDTHRAVLTPNSTFSGKLT